jgi:Tol biopolymer transport system component
MKNRQWLIGFTVMLELCLIGVLLDLVALPVKAMTVTPDWKQINIDGLGDPLPRQLPPFEGFGDYLYAGVWHFLTPETASAETWRTSKGTEWEQVSFVGFGDANNKWSYRDNATTVYKDHLNNTANNWVTGDEVWRMGLNTNKTYLPLLLKNYPVIETGKVVFVSNRDGNDEIYSMNYDGSGVIRLTNNSSEDFGPRWSPDGSKIVFDSDRTGEYEIYIMNANGSNQQKITSMAYSFSPRWSPDGTRIAFVNDNGSGTVVYTMNPSGGDLLAVTDPAMYASSPCWSPNGERIAFIGSLTAPGIYMVDANGSNQELIYASEGLASFAWSPDGKQIALTKWAAPDLNFDLYLYDIGRAEITRLTTTTRNHLMVGWSPYGHYLIFSSNRDDLTNFEIYTMDLIWRSVENLTHNQAADVGPDWIE